MYNNPNNLNGLLIQWGFSNSLLHDITISFLSKFSTTNYAFIGDYQVWSDNNEGMKITKNVQSIIISCENNHHGFKNWIAIGY